MRSFGHESGHRHIYRAICVLKKNDYFRQRLFFYLIGNYWYCLDTMDQHPGQVPKTFPYLSRRHILYQDSSYEIIIQFQRVECMLSVSLGRIQGRVAGGRQRAWVLTSTSNLTKGQQQQKQLNNKKQQYKQTVSTTKATIQ